MNARLSFVEDLAALLERLVDERIEARMRGAGSSSSVYSQRDGQRPVGCGAAKYLRAWRRGRDAGDRECWAEGRARLMTADAWRRLSAAPSASRPPRLAVVPPPSPRTVDDEVLEQLGARRRAGGVR